VKGERLKVKLAVESWQLAVLRTETEEQGRLILTGVGQKNNPNLLALFAFH